MYSCATRTNPLNNLFIVIGYCIYYTLPFLFLLRSYNNMEVTLILRLFLFLDFYFRKHLKSVNPIYPLLLFCYLYPYFQDSPLFFIVFTIIYLYIIITKELILDLISALEDVLRIFLIFLIDLFDTVYKIKVSLSFQNSSSFAIVLLDILLFTIIFIFLATLFIIFICGYIFICYSMILCSFCNSLLIHYFDTSILVLLSCRAAIYRIIKYAIRLRDYINKHHSEKVKYVLCAAPFSAVRSPDRSNPPSSSTEEGSQPFEAGNYPEAPRTPKAVEDPNGSFGSSSNPLDGSNITAASLERQAGRSSVNSEEMRAVSVSVDSEVMQADRSVSSDEGVFRPIHRGFLAGNVNNLGSSPLENYYSFMDPLNMGAIDPENFLFEGLPAPSFDRLSTSMNNSPNVTHEEVSIANVETPSNVLPSSDDLPSSENFPITSSPKRSSKNMEE